MILSTTFTILLEGRLRRNSMASPAVLSDGERGGWRLVRNSQKASQYSSIDFDIFGDRFLQTGNSPNAEQVELISTRSHKNLINNHSWWGLDVSSTCVLCNAQPESRNHLYFNCPFAFAIWSVIASRRSLHALQTWESTVTQLRQLTGSKHGKRLTLLCWQSTIYSIWRERNERLHRAIFRTPDSIVVGLDRLIRNRIQSIRVSNPRSSSAMMQHWLGGN